MRRLSVLSVLALAALVGGGCGDDEEERLSQADFEAQANAICAEGNQEIEALFEELPQDQAPSEAELEPLYDDFIDNVRGQIDAVADLRPPEDIQDDVDAFLDDARSALGGMEDAGPSALLSDEDPFADVNAQARDLGLTECAG
jgi:hypothetical protein